MAYKRKAQRYKTTNKRYKKTPYRSKRKSYRRKPTTRGRGSFNKKVMAVIKRTAEPKMKHQNMNQAIFNGPTKLYHNSFNRWSIFDLSGNQAMFPYQGDDKDQRNGDEIFSKGFMIRGSFGFAGDRRVTTLRFYLVKPFNATSTLSYDNMFQAITGNVALDPLDKTQGGYLNIEIILK